MLLIDMDHPCPVVLFKFLPRGVAGREGAVIAKPAHHCRWGLSTEVLEVVSNPIINRVGEELGVAPKRARELAAQFLKVNARFAWV